MDHTYQVKKDELLAKIRENRDAHRELFLSALDGYGKALRTELQAHLDQIESGKLPDIRINRSRPVDHTRDYDDAITMLEMCVSDDVPVTQEQISCYVNDNWDWQRQWGASNSAYTDTTRYTSKFSPSL